jgi:hypothetical protein
MQAHSLALELAAQYLARRRLVLRQQVVPGVGSGAIPDKWMFVLAK